MALLMGCAVFSLTLCGLPYPLMLLMQIAVGTAVYALESVLLHNENFEMVKGIAMKAVRGKKAN